jgi:hypothetical protein
MSNNAWYQMQTSILISKNINGVTYDDGDSKRLRNATPHKSVIFKKWNWFEIHGYSQLLDTAKIGTLEWRKRWLTCDIPIERETLQVCLYEPTMFSYVGGCQGCRLSENGDTSREWPAAASLATRITWSDAMRIFSCGRTLRTRYCTALAMGSAWAAKTNHRCHLKIDREMLRWVCVEIDYRIGLTSAASQRANTQSIYEVCKINLESFSFYRYVACYHPLCHSSVPIFCNMPEIMNNPVYKL